MKVSVIIPTRNRKHMLRQALLSVYHQTVPPAEIIIIDDASDEDITTMFAEYECSPIRLRYLRQPTPMGACAARNKGAYAAQHDILMFLDDDDTWEPEKIEKQLLIFANHDGVGLVYGGRLLVLDSDRQTVIGKIKPKASGRLFPDILYNNLIGSTSSVALRKQLFIDVGGFDEQFPAKQDYDLWIRCAKKTRIEHDNSFNVRYTVFQKPGSQISGKRGVHKKAVELLLNKYNDDIHGQGWIGRRKIVAVNYYTIAKATQKQSYWLGFLWCIKSLCYYPSFRSLLLVLHPQLVYWMRKALTSRKSKMEVSG